MEIETPNTPPVEFAEPITATKTRIRGAYWKRATLALSAAALAVSCTSPRGDISESTASTVTTRPGIVSPTIEMPQSQRFLSASEAVNAAENEKSINLSHGVIDSSLLLPQLSETDYKSLKNGNTTYDESRNTASVMEIRYDSKNRNFRYDDQSPGGLGKELAARLLKSAVRDNDVVRAAFELGHADRVVIRQNKPTGNPDWDKSSHKEYVEADNTDPSKGTQKTIFIFLPGNMSISQTEYDDAINHEAIHGLIRSHGLSQEFTSIKQSDINDWREVCVGIRNIAVDQAEKHSKEIAEIMETGKSEFRDPVVLSAFNEIYDALKAGEFNNYQPLLDQRLEAFSTKFPECQTLGPWGSFVRLLEAKGKKPPQSDGITKMYTLLQDKWFDILEEETIFVELREGTYDDESRNKKLGHPFDTWDELTTSVNNVVLRHTEKAGEMLELVRPDIKPNVSRLVNLALTALESQLPPGTNQTLRDKIVRARTMLQAALG